MQGASTIPTLIYLLVIIATVVRSAPVAPSIYSEDDVVNMRLAGHDERDISRALSLHHASPAYLFTTPNGHLTGQEVQQRPIRSVDDEVDHRAVQFALVPHQEALKSKLQAMEEQERANGYVVSQLFSGWFTTWGRQPSLDDLQVDTSIRGKLRPRWVVGP